MPPRRYRVDGAREHDAGGVLRCPFVHGATLQHVLKHVSQGGKLAMVGISAGMHHNPMAGEGEP
jgi:hypothetical protein